MSIFLIRCPSSTLKGAGNYWGGTWYTNGKTYHPEAGWANRWVEPENAVAFNGAEQAEQVRALLRLDYYLDGEIRPCEIVEFKKALAENE